MLTSMIVIGLPAYGHAQISPKDFLPRLNSSQANPEADFEEYLKVSRTKRGMMWTKWAVRPQDSCPVRIHVSKGNRNDNSSRCLKAYVIPDGPSSSEFVFVLNEVIYTFYSNTPLPRYYFRDGEYRIPVASVSQGPRRHVPGPQGLKSVRWPTPGTCQIFNSFSQGSHLACSADDGQVSISILLNTNKS